MEFIRINDQLGIDTQAPQRLIHLLAALHRDVEIPLPAKEHGWRGDAVGMQKRVRNLLVGFPGLGVPRRSDFVVVLNDVLIGAIKCHRERGARPTGGGLQPMVRRNHVIGQNAAVAPAPHAHMLLVGHPHPDDMFDSGFQIFHFIVTPVAGDGPGVPAAAA